MLATTKLKLTYATIGVFYLLGGIEYAVILPTLWLYIQHRFNAPPIMLGLIMTAFPLSGLFAAPLLGRWSDRTGNTKAVLLIANLFEIVGSLMYFLGNNFNVWFLVGSRLVAGVGTGVGAAIFADIARVTSVKARTGVLSIFMAIRQFGMLAGPACNLFLRELDFHIGNFPVDKYTSPGLLMALLWLLLQLLVLLFYWNLPPLKLEIDLQAQREATPTGDSCGPALPGSSYSINVDGETHVTHGDGEVNAGHTQHGRRTPVRWSPERRRDDGSYSSNDMIEDAERCMQQRDASPPHSFSSSGDFPPLTIQAVSPQQPLSTAEPAYQQTAVSSEDTDTEPRYNQVSVSCEVGPSPRQPSPAHTPKVKFSWRFMYDEYVRDEVVAILAAVFVAFFNQTALETLCTPLTASLLDWGELENSVLYTAAAVEILAVFALLRLVLSRRCSDRALLLAGLVAETAALAFSTWFIPAAKPHAPAANTWGVAVAVFLDILGLPLIAVCSTSLYSKITRPETQGLSQGVRRVFVSLATILGPLWPGGMMQHKYVMLGAMLAVNSLGLVLLIASYPRLTPAPPVVTDGTDERRPLLADGRNNSRRSRYSNQ